jgi:hypothetical protein
MTTILKGKKGEELLVGSPLGTTFIYNIDGVYADGTHGTLTGDPGHPGLNAPFATGGFNENLDVFQGVAGVHNVLQMGNGHSALFLGDSSRAFQP